MFSDVGFAFGMHAFWWIFWIIVVTLAVWGVASGWGARGDERETPLETLRRRYARGEIGTQEYEERKAILNRDAGES